MNPETQALWRAGAAGLARAYRGGALSPVDVLEACLARIDAVDPVLNALVAPRDRSTLRAEAAASAARIAAGRPLSSIDGIPLTVKDNILTADQPTSWGCRALASHRSGVDELPVARARAAGALLLGKTNCPEFTLEGYTDNPLFGVTRNPWRPELTPGGSSGGAVAGVAAGMSPLALGTDGGGSIRRPASHCGLVGLKPSIGAVARDRTLPPLLLDFEVVGPIARSVADARMLFDAVRGPSLRDRRSLAARGAATPRPASGRLAILYVDRLAGAPVDPAIAASCSAAAGILRDLGHDVVDGQLPLDLGFMTESWPVVGQIGLSWMFGRHPEWRGGASGRYLDMAAQGDRLPAARLWEVLESVEQLRRDCAALFERFDLVMTPATAALPWAADQPYPKLIDGQEVGPRGHAVFTGWVNAAGLPALALPSGPVAEGLPTGFQLIGAYGADDLLLDLGESYEAAAPWAHRWPAL